MLPVTIIKTIIKVLFHQREKQARRKTHIYIDRLFVRVFLRLLQCPKS